MKIGTYLLSCYYYIHFNLKTNEKKSVYIQPIQILCRYKIAFTVTGRRIGIGTVVEGGSRGGAGEGESRIVSNLKMKT